MPELAYFVFTSLEPWLYEFIKESLPDRIGQNYERKSEKYWEELWEEFQVVLTEWEKLYFKPQSYDFVLDKEWL